MLAAAAAVRTLALRAVLAVPVVVVLVRLAVVQWRGQLTLAAGVVVVVTRLAVAEQARLAVQALLYSLYLFRR